MTKEYNIQDIIQANITIRKEFSDKLKEYDRKFDSKIREIKGYQVQIDNLKEEVRKLSDANRSLSLTVSSLESKTSKPKVVSENLPGRGTIEFLLRSNKLNNWEKEFLMSVVKLRGWTPKQEEVIKKIVAKYN